MNYFINLNTDIQEKMNILQFIIDVANPPKKIYRNISSFQTINSIFGDLVFYHAMAKAITNTLLV